MNKKLINKILVVALHVFGWALLFMLPYRMLIRRAHDRGMTDHAFDSVPAMPATPIGEGAPELHITTPGNIPTGPFHTQTIAVDPMWFQVEAITTNVLLAIFFYTNMFVLVPRVLTRRGWPAYMLCVLLAFSIYIAVGYMIRLNLMPEGIFVRRFGPPVFMGMPNFLMVFGLSLALRIMQDRSDFETGRKEQENEKLKSELSFLRSQVSPHFMFNVLNSLASLARKKSDRVEDAIIQLSQLMRYSLYHTDKKVTLEQEAEYLNNYIELQKLRFGASVEMHFHVDIVQRDVMIEPMLLVPFVENAFKHGVGLMANPVIIIMLKANGDNIHFAVRNKFNTSPSEIKDASSGIGLQNVKRRLDLLYKDHYTLNIYATKENWFITELTISHHDDLPGNR
ncbi:sensor histidine kinase [Parachryseolinea silvisoli]|uniref:sensor histidine kinase n=1 Tax=Parachryseolinea silvisoli TaxID=2873601 RepID=UPI002265ED51|nr:histidine kinase [Parachryseolinea silvisoli]MCD9015847.1 histidine kinase [Parachryseolinea silvisoli]